MPRKARIDGPGAFHLIIVRGIDRTTIFRDDTDYENFLSRLSRLLIESSTPCLAWALMGNHVHMLLRTGRLPISALMRRLMTGYAQQFNRRAGGQNFGQQVQMAGLPASLQGAYLQNALAALQGQGGLSQQALNQLQASITASTAQNQARTMTAAPLASFAGKAFGEVGGQAENLGALFTSIAGNKSATDAIGGALGGIFGGSNRPAPTNPNVLF